MTRSDGQQHARVGAMALGAFGLVTGLFLLKGADRLLGRTYPLHVELPSVEGLAEGAEVQFRGYRVGYVEGIAWEGGSPPRFRVTFRVTRKIRLPEGTALILLPKGLSAAYLDVLWPERPGADLAPGATLPGSAGPTLASLLGRADGALTGMYQVARRLSQEGLGSLLRDPGTQRLVTELRALAREARKAASGAEGLMEDGRSLLARNGPALDRSLASLERNLAQAEEGTRQIRAYLDAHREALQAAPGAMVRAAERVDQAGEKVGGLVDENRQELRALLGTFESTLGSLEELLEILKAKPNRVIFGQVAPEELEAARARVRARRKVEPSK